MPLKYWITKHFSVLLSTDAVLGSIYHQEHYSKQVAKNFSMVLLRQADPSLWSCYAMQADPGYPSMYYFSMVLPCQLELEGEQLGDDLSCNARQILDIPLCIISLWSCPVSC
jgi:hypothetical protein